MQNQYNRQILGKRYKYSSEQNISFVVILEK